MRLRSLGLAFAAILSFGSAAFAQGGPPPIEAAQPLVREVTDHDVFTGRFEPVQEVELRARVTGYLDSVSFEDGDIVEKGQQLFSIDTQTFAAAVARANAALTAAKAARDLARVEFDRATQLARRNVGTVQEVDRTRATLAEAEAQVEVSEAELRTAELDLAFTKINAPFAGRMSNRKVDPGNLIVGGAGNATLLSTIVSTDPIHFTFTGSEADFLRYTRRLGPDSSARERRTEVAIRLMDEADFTHTGVINFVDNALDPNSGTITVRAVVPNPNRLLIPGIFGRVRVPASEPYEALLIPDTAILSDQARKIVMVVDAEGTVSPRPVTPGQMHRGLRVIRSGLQPGDMVIVNGVQRARPGSKVTVETTELTLAEK